MADGGGGGDMGGGGFVGGSSDNAPPATPPAPTVSTGGTKRDFGNMLNAYIPHHVRVRKGDLPKLGFSPWTQMAAKQEKIK